MEIKENENKEKSSSIYEKENSKHENYFPIDEKEITKVIKNSSVDEKENSKVIKNSSVDEKENSKNKKSSSIDEKIVRKDNEYNPVAEKEIIENNNNKPIIKKDEDITKYVNSKIIFTKNELKFLKRKFNKGNKKLHVFFDIIYRATDDGDNASEIKKIIKNKKETLTLFYTNEDARFGIYIEKSHYTIFGKSLKESKGKCFIVSLNNLEIYDIFEGHSATENKSDILCFFRNKKKNKNGSEWAIFTPQKKFLQEECILGELNDFFDIEDLSIIIGKKHDYYLKEVEIFEVAFEEEGENEENNMDNE